MGSFMPLPFGPNRERSPRPIFSAETSQARLATLANTIQNIDAALQQGQFPGMSFEQTPAAPQVAPQMYPTTEVAAGATAMQTVEAPEPDVAPESEIFHAQSPEALIMNQTVQMVDPNEFTQAA